MASHWGSEKWYSRTQLPRPLNYHLLQKAFVSVLTVPEDPSLYDLNMLKRKKEKFIG